MRDRIIASDAEVPAVDSPPNPPSPCAVCSSAGRVAGVLAGAREVEDTGSTRPPARASVSVSTGGRSAGAVRAEFKLCVWCQSWPGGDLRGDGKA